MSRILYHPNLRDHIENYIQRCETCQKHKLHGRRYGHLAPQEALVAPWYEVAIGMIGPWWEIELQNNETRKISCTDYDQYSDKFGRNATSEFRKCAGFSERV